MTNASFEKTELGMLLKKSAKNAEAFYKNILQQSEVLKLLIDYFEDNNIEFGFLGGSVRKAIQGPTIDYPRDIDIIFDGDDIAFDLYLQKNHLEYCVNSFGGRKIKVDGFTFDVWSLQKHYLIADGKYPKSFEYVLDTTFINYDSIFFNWTKKEIIGKYFICLRTKVIDFVGEKEYINLNKYPTVSICKMAILQNDGYTFSKDVENWIKKQLESFENFGKFIYEYERHLGCPLSGFIKNIIKDFLQQFGVKF